MAATLSSSLFFLHSSLSPSTTKKIVVPTKIAIFPILPEEPCVLFSKTRSSFVRNVVTTSEFDQEAGLHVSERRSGSSEDLKLFVGNLSFGIDSANLAELFGQAGTVKLVEVIYDKETGRSRGFASVTMSTVEEVEAAAQQFNGYDLDGRPLQVNFGPPPPCRDGPPSPRRHREGASARRNGADSVNRIYVGNLSWGVDDLALENLFNEKGRVMEAKVVYDRYTGRSRGFGFVTYNSAEEANSAVSSLDGVDLDGRAIHVSVAVKCQF